MIFEMVRPDFLMRSLIMPSLKAQLFLVKKLSWLFQRPVTAAVAAEAAFLLLRRRLMRLCVHNRRSRDGRPACPLPAHSMLWLRGRGTSLHGDWVFATLMRRDGLGVACLPLWRRAIDKATRPRDALARQNSTSRLRGDNPGDTTSSATGESSGD